jgi:hypothetical protein
MFDLLNNCEAYCHITTISDQILPMRRRFIADFCQLSVFTASCCNSLDETTLRKEEQNENWHYEQG